MEFSDGIVFWVQTPDQKVTDVVGALSLTEAVSNTSWRIKKTDSFCRQTKTAAEVIAKMALRPIDNALPTTPERPKKQAKVSIPIQTQKKPSDFGVLNDENKAPLPPSAEASIDYGVEEMKEFGFVTLLQIAADLLNDRLPEAREAARSIVFSVYKAFTGNEDENPEAAWQSFCLTSLSAIQAQSMVKVISS
ncbi:hypothetical protein V6N13_040552 [Hibiscus sabdariffa]